MRGCSSKSTEPAPPHSGIYHFEAETLTICMADRHDGPRPTTFESTKGSGRVLIELHRKAAGEVTD